MKYAKFLPAAALALSLIMPMAAHAAVITFDEFAADNYTQGGIPAGRYAYLGVTFSTTDDGSTWDGTANGDPGFWFLNGTNGPIFSGYNGNSYGARMLFTATDVSGVLLDAARPWASSGDVTFTLQGWLDGALVDSEIVIMAPNIVNQWSTLSLTGVFDELHGNRRAWHLDQRENAFLHPGAARSWNGNQGCVFIDGSFCGADKAFADSGAHRSTHEIKIESCDDGSVAANGAFGDDDCIFFASLSLGVFQTVCVFFLVAEFQRVSRDIWHAHCDVLAFIKQACEAVFDREFQVMSAMRADIQIFREVTVEQHPFAGWAFLPEIVRDFFLTDDRVDLRADEI